ncbi:MAG: hypothetical protein ACRDBP_05535 [Luteolibacter sp.]
MIEVAAITGRRDSILPPTRRPITAAIIPLMTTLTTKHQRLAALRPLSPESVASLAAAWDVRMVYEPNKESSFIPFFDLSSSAVKKSSSSIHLTRGDP